MRTRQLFTAALVVVDAGSQPKRWWGTNPENSTCVIVNSQQLKPNLNFSGVSAQMQVVFFGTVFEHFAMDGEIIGQIRIQFELFNTF